MLKRLKLPPALGLPWTDEVEEIIAPLPYNAMATSISSWCNDSPVLPGLGAALCWGAILVQKLCASQKVLYVPVRLAEGVLMS